MDNFSAQNLPDQLQNNKKLVPIFFRSFTTYLTQTLDVTLNKPFKEKLRQCVLENQMEFKFEAIPAKKQTMFIIEAVCNIMNYLIKPESGMLAFKHCVISKVLDGSGFSLIHSQLRATIEISNLVDLNQNLKAEADIIDEDSEDGSINEDDEMQRSFLQEEIENNKYID